MTRRKDAFGLKMSAEACMEAAIETATLEGWQIKDRGKSQLKLKETGHSFFQSPVKMTVILKSEAPDITRVTVKGKKLGLGPIQWRRINRKMADFRRRMELAASQGKVTTGT